MNHTTLSYRRLRSHVIQALRHFFQLEDLDEIFTPLKVNEVNTEPHIHYYRIGNHYLIGSPELAMKEHLFLLWEAEPEGRPGIFQISPVFREGKDENGVLHNNEFIMTEYYHPCETLEEGMDFFKNLVKSVFHAFHCTTIPPLQIFKIEDLFYQRTGVSLDTNHTDCLLDALKKFNPHSASLHCKTKKPDWNELFFEVYVSALEPWLELQEFCAITHFPRRISSMARPSKENPSMVDRFEILFRGVELCNGYMECFHPGIIRQQMEQDKSAMEQNRKLPESWLKKLENNWHKHQNSIPSMCGVSLGVERLCLMLTQHQRKGLGEGIHPFI